MAVELQPGAVVAGRYRLERRIGEGGMGVVWAAFDITKERDVAVKHLRREAAGDAETRRRFLREAEATSAIAHPNIVSVLDLVETEGGLPAIVMDKLEGESLRARLDRERRIPLADAAGILIPVVSAVGTAHALGIVHRDLKPDNIFVAQTPEGGTVIKVLDFGIAKLTQSAPDAANLSVITGTWSLLGTPYYMSPEQIVGEKDIDHRADMWSLGAILYECLSGRRPAEGASPGKIFEQILLRGIRPLASAAPGVPADVASLVDQLLSRERDERPWDLHEVLDVLATHTEVTAPAFGRPAGARPSMPEGRDPKRSFGGASKSRESALTTTAPDLRWEDDDAPSTKTAPGIVEPTPPVPAALTSATLPAGGADAPPKKGVPEPAAPSLLRSKVVLSLGGAIVGAALLVTSYLVTKHFTSDWGSAYEAARVSADPPGVGAPGHRPPSTATGAGASVPTEAGRTAGPPSSQACPPGMAPIPGGAFLMGSSEGKDDEKPVHRVEVRAFCMDRTEVTVEAYAACVGEGACTPAAATVSWSTIRGEAKPAEGIFCNGSKGDRKDRPINCVDWIQADKYCRSRSRRLPTEEEWEYAARAGSEQRTYAWGPMPPGPELANLCAEECRARLRQIDGEPPVAGGSPVAGAQDGFDETAPVGRFPKGASRDGVQDLTGNVWEWTASPYCPYPSHSCSNPERVLRGAGWATTQPTSFRATSRLSTLPAHRAMDIGLRCVSSPQGGGR